MLWVADECREFPLGTSQGVLGTALSLQVSGFSPVPRTLGIWKRLGTWVTDQPFFNILPQAWVHFSRMKIQMDTCSALGILLCWHCAKFWDIFREWRGEYKDVTEISENYIWEYYVQAVEFWGFFQWVALLSEQLQATYHFWLHFSRTFDCCL